MIETSFKDILRKHTKEFNELLNTDNQQLSEKADKILKIVKRRWPSDYKKSMLDIAGVLLDFDVGTVAFKALTCVMVKNNPNDHCYPLNQILIGINSHEHQALYYCESRGGWRIGDHLPIGKENYARVTVDQVEDFFLRDDTKQMFSIVLQNMSRETLAELL